MEKFKTIVRLIPEEDNRNDTDPLFIYSRYMPVPCVGEVICYHDVDYRVHSIRHIPEYSTIVVFVCSGKNIDECKI